MTALEQLQTGIAQLGELLDDIEEIVEEPDGNEWTIEMSDGTLLELEYDEERQRLSLSTTLGSPPPEHRAHTCEMLLTFNLLWQDEPPVRMAVGAPGEDVIQIAEFPLTTFDAHRLGQWVAEFHAMATDWSEHVASGFQFEEEAPLPLPFTESSAFRA